MLTSRRTLVEEYSSQQNSTMPRKKQIHPSQNNKRKIRAVALDLDGTLLHSKNHQISSESIQYLRKLDSRGIQILIATGRPAKTVMPHVQTLNLPRPLPVVASNGAQGLLCQASPNNNVSVQTLFSFPVSLDIAKRVIDFATRYKHVVQYVHGDTVYANPSLPSHFDLINRYSEQAGCKVVHVDDNFHSLLESKQLPSKLLLLCVKEDMDRMYKHFQQAFDTTKELTLVGGKSRQWFLEILAPNICKGSGLQEMCDKLNLSTEECVAFGDASNDLEFLQVAGKGIAMKNARPKVKEVADEVTLYTNNEDGVRKALQKMEKKGMLRTTRTSHMWISPGSLLKAMTREIDCSEELLIQSMTAGCAI